MHLSFYLSFALVICAKTVQYIKACCELSDRVTFLVSWGRILQSRVQGSPPSEGLNRGTLCQEWSFNRYTVITQKWCQIGSKCIQYSQIGSRIRTFDLYQNRLTLSNLEQPGTFPAVCRVQRLCFLHQSSDWLGRSSPKWPTGWAKKVSHYWSVNKLC